MTTLPLPKCSAKDRASLVAYHKVRRHNLRVLGKCLACGHENDRRPMVTCSGCSADKNAKRKP